MLRFLVLMATTAALLLLPLFAVSSSSSWSASTNKNDNDVQHQQQNHQQRKSLTFVGVRLPSSHREFFPPAETTVMACNVVVPSAATALIKVEAMVLDLPRSAPSADQRVAVLFPPSRRDSSVNDSASLLASLFNSEEEDNETAAGGRNRTTTPPVIIIDASCVVTPRVKRSRDGKQRQERVVLRVGFHSLLRNKKKETSAAKQQQQQQQHRTAQAQQGSSGAPFSLDATRSYSSYSTIVSRMNKLAADYPHLVHTFSLAHKSFEGRDIRAARLSSSTAGPRQDDPSKQELLFVGAMHAREWIAADVCIGLLQALVNMYHVNAEVRKIVDFFEFVFVPVMNPDGLEFSRASSDSTHRLWRKNRRPPNGVDLNRNFPTHWGLDSGSSAHPHELTYRGTHAGSEPETQAIMALASPTSSSRQVSKLALSLSFHSYGASVLYPPGHELSATSDTSVLCEGLFKRAVNFKHSISGLKFGVSPAWALYPVSGDLIDWLHTAHDNLPSATVELRPTNNGCCGFELPSDQIPFSILEQTAFVLHTAATIKNVSSNGATNNNNNWWRTGGAGSAVRTDVGSFAPSADSLLDVDGDTLQDFFDPCLHKSLTTASWTATSSIANYLDAPLVGTLRRKFLEIQHKNDMDCRAPWVLYSRAESYQVFGGGSRSAIIASASAATIKAWKANTPTVADTRSAVFSDSRSIPLEMTMRINTDVARTMGGVSCGGGGSSSSSLTPSVMVAQSRIGVWSCPSSSSSSSSTTTVMDNRAVFSSLISDGTSLLIHSQGCASSSSSCDTCTVRFSLVRSSSSATAWQQIDADFQSLASSVAVASAAADETLLSCPPPSLLSVLSLRIPSFNDPSSQAGSGRVECGCVKAMMVFLVMLCAVAQLFAV